MKGFLKNVEKEMIAGEDIESGDVVAYYLPENNILTPSTVITGGGNTLVDSSGDILILHHISGTGSSNFAVTKFDGNTFDEISTIQVNRDAFLPGSNEITFKELLHGTYAGGYLVSWTQDEPTNIAGEIGILKRDLSGFHNSWVYDINSLMGEAIEDDDGNIVVAYYGNPSFASGYMKKFSQAGVLLDEIEYDDDNGFMSNLIQDPVSGNYIVFNLGNPTYGVGLLAHLVDKNMTGVIRRLKINATEIEGYITHKLIDHEGKLICLSVETNSPYEFKIHKVEPDLTSVISSLVLHNPVSGDDRATLRGLMMINNNLSYYVKYFIKGVTVPADAGMWFLKIAPNLSSVEKTIHVYEVITSTSYNDLKIYASNISKHRLYFILTLFGQSVLSKLTDTPGFYIYDSFQSVPKNFFVAKTDVKEGYYLKANKQGDVITISESGTIGDFVYVGKNAKPTLTSYGDHLFLGKLADTNKMILGNLFNFMPLSHKTYDVLVSKTGFGDFDDIADAVENSPEMSVILVDIGEYVVNQVINVKNGQKIIAAEYGAVKIKGILSGYYFSMQGNSFGTILTTLNSGTITFNTSSPIPTPSANSDLLLVAPNGYYRVVSGFGGTTGTLDRRYTGPYSFGVRYFFDARSYCSIIGFDFENFGFYTNRASNLNIDIITFDKDLSLSGCYKSKFKIKNFLSVSSTFSSYTKCIFDIDNNFGTFRIVDSFDSIVDINNSNYVIIYKNNNCFIRVKQSNYGFQITAGSSATTGNFGPNYIMIGTATTGDAYSVGIPLHIYAGSSRTVNNYVIKIGAIMNCYKSGIIIESDTGIIEKIDLDIGRCVNTDIEGTGNGDIYMVGGADTIRAIVLKGGDLGNVTAPENVARSSIISGRYDSLVNPVFFNVNNGLEY